MVLPHCDTEAFRDLDSCELLCDIELRKSIAYLDFVLIIAVMCRG